MYLLSQRADWNQTKEGLKLLAAQDPQANLLAVADIGANNPLGSGLVLNVGESLAWIGMILVHPDHRRRGIASAIMEECIEVARLAMDSSIVGLDATPAGLQVYKNIGFRESFKLWRCKLNTDTIIERDKAVKITSLSSIDKHSNFLRAVKLDKKLAGLRLIHKMYPEGSFLAQFQGEPCGTGSVSG